MKEPEVWSVEPTFDADGVQVGSGIDEFGREWPDNIPMAPPVGMSQGLSRAEVIRMMIRTAVSAQAEEQGEETFEEADDFDCSEFEDDVDPHTPYEAVFDPPPPKAAAVAVVPPGKASPGASGDAGEPKGGSGGALPPPQGDPAKPGEGGATGG